MKAEDLKKMKNECGLTTRQISELSGIPESTISRVLSGQTDNPTFDTVCAIVKAMGGSLDKLADMPGTPDRAEPSPLVKLYEQSLADKNRYIRFLFITCSVLVAVLVFIVIYDMTNRSLGFFRY